MRRNHRSKLILLHAITAFLHFVLMCSILFLNTTNWLFKFLFKDRQYNNIEQNISPLSMWIVSRYFLARSWAVILGRRWELAFLVEETAGLFTTNLSKSTVLSVFNERNYILPNNWQLRLFFSAVLAIIYSVIQIYQPFRLANPNKGFLCVTPIGNSLRMRLVPGPRHAK